MIPAPKEFRTFGNHFVELDMHTLPREGAYLRMMEFALGYIKTDAERRTLRDYLNQLIASKYTEKELQALWGSTRTGLVFYPARPLFRIFRDRLNEMLGERS